MASDSLALGQAPRVREDPGDARQATIDTTEQFLLRVRVWPRDYPAEQVARVLSFVARGEFTSASLSGLLFRIECTTAGVTHWIARATIRRAKLERRIRWCNVSHQYVARPAWQHRPRHDRRGWRWP